ncbi:MAG: DUF3109 family protein [Bacteroidetes bacterium]|nr:MAG: DUF3109 family protein [Bacteroidota bacterium]
MIVIEDKIISRDLLEKQFLCNLEACKGACCWEGDAGAPLEAEEIPVLEAIFERVRPYLSPAGLAAIEKEGLYVHHKADNTYSTSLVDNGPCSFMTIQGGVARCGIEQAYQDGQIDFPKPVSCHLYPIRITRLAKAGLEALNYDQWDICSAACEKGRQAQLPIFRFVKNGLIRKYGEAFYAELEAVAAHLERSE